MSRSLPDGPGAAWRTQAALFLVSQNLSLFGSSVVGFALVWHITLETTSGLWMTLATVACHGPQVLVLLWGGVWADRHDRRLLIALSDGFVALVTLGLALAFLGGLGTGEAGGLWPLLGVLALRSLGGGVQGPASAALYPQIVPPEHLARVQGLNQSINALLMLLSPAAGGLLLGTVDLAWAMLLDVVTAALAIAVLYRIRLDRAPRGAGDASAWADIRRGLSYTFGHGRLRLLVLCYGAFYFLATPAAVLCPLMVARSFGPEVWRLTANELAWSGMSLLGGAFVSWHGDFKDRPRVMALCMAVFGVAFGLLGLAPNFAVFLALVGLGGFFMPVFATASTVFIQKTAAGPMLGRVFSIVQLIASGGMPTAILVFGPLADVVSVESLLVFSGVSMALVGGVYFRFDRRARGG